VVLAKDPIQVLWPIQVELLVHQSLSSFDMANGGERIFLFHVVHLVAIHWSAQPFTAVDADVDLEGKPTLQPQVHEPKLRMQMVEVEMLALAAFELELQLFGLAIATEEISAAGLHAAKDTDQALLESVFVDEFPCQGFLARITGGQVTKRTPGDLGHVEGCVLDALG
jgi:hypothetical protein